MEQVAWTDERLEQRFDGIDRRFDQVDRRFDEADRRFTEMNESVNHRFNEVDRRIIEGDRVVGHRFDAVDRRIDEMKETTAELAAGVRDFQLSVLELHRVFFGGSVGVIVGLIGLIATIWLRGG